MAKIVGVAGAFRASEQRGYTSTSRSVAGLPLRLYRTDFLHTGCISKSSLAPRPHCILVGLLLVAGLVRKLVFERSSLSPVPVASRCCNSSDLPFAIRCVWPASTISNIVV